MRKDKLVTQNRKATLHLFFTGSFLDTEKRSGSVALERNSILSGADRILSVAESCLQMQGSSCVYLRAPRGQRLPGAEHQTDG